MTNTMSEEILPCPFCGGKGHALAGMVAFNDVEITCTVCSVTGGNEDGEGATVAENRANAIAAWNRRSVRIPTREEVARVIDPDVWGETPEWDALAARNFPWRRHTALTTADRLLSLMQQGVVNEASE